MSNDRLNFLINQAEELMQARDYESAIAIFQQALEIDPNNTEVLRKCGKALTSYAKVLKEGNRLDKRLEILKTLVDIEPKNPKNLRSYANALTKNNQHEKAFYFFEQALQIEPNNLITLRSYANALTATNQYEKAFQLFEQALQLEPNEPRTLRSYANALTATNQHEKAFQLFEQALQLKPSNPITLRSYAHALIETNQHEKAFQLFEQALQLEPNNLKTLHSYANSLIAANQYEKALPFFERLLEIEYNNPIMLNSYAYALIVTDQYNKALPLFERSIQIEPNNAIILSRYAIALASNGEDEKALPFFEKALKIGLQNPNTRNNFIYFQYAPALERLGKYQEAINQLLAIRIKALTQYEANIILLNLGRLYYWIKQPEKGNEYFEAAIANSDDKEKTLLYSARSILANNPHNETAIAMLQQIEKDSPRYAEAKEMLTLNLSEEDYFEMVKTDVQSGLSNTEMLNRAMYHKIANEISILKGIAYRISRRSDLEYPLLSGIIQDIEDVFEEVNRRRAAQKSEIETVPHDDYGQILAVISKTAHDISDFVNNQLAVIESKTRRAMRKLASNDEHYTRFEKLLVQLELTQSALSDLKAINEGITIKNHRFKVKELFEKWKTTCQIDNAWIILQIRNGDSQFYGDEEKIKSALNELVENSLKHNADQQKLTIHITSQDVVNPSGIRGMNIPGEQKYLLIEFADNGKGVPEYNKDWIFQPLKTTSQEGKGSGLGLFIIRKTLTQMNGYIRETGQDGARFEIYIPYVEGDA
ncbi:tetratricopeptide repeat protein [Kamptonema animale CS-326]|jgi:tetratricopeptide (TPR) repeat protein/anti-sigma regulatory factor (Ser/Thr protein kinase)|uniref:tetratricopeptide repeat protein n=1 Tax=Kamptonema animale TaxID=92934 RepID=UPI00232C2A48|nr:tetratricopeptide repeat protein [Kamptonema animale]MDB9513807.1 tetratricopeptide repeat protein [Kamptonema animale CS-326]